MSNETLIKYEAIILWEILELEVCLDLFFNLEVVTEWRSKSTSFHIHFLSMQDVPTLCMGACEALCPLYIFEYILFNLFSWLLPLNCYLSWCPPLGKELHYTLIIFIFYHKEISLIYYLRTFSCLWKAWQMISWFSSQKYKSLSSCYCSPSSSYFLIIFFVSSDICIYNLLILECPFIFLL